MLKFIPYRRILLKDPINLNVKSQEKKMLQPNLRKSRRVGEPLSFYYVSLIVTLSYIFHIPLSDFSFPVKSKICSLPPTSRTYLRKPTLFILGVMYSPRLRGTRRGGKGTVLEPRRRDRDEV